MISTKLIFLALCFGENVQSIPQFYGTDSYYQPGQRNNFNYGSNGYGNLGRPRNQWADRNPGRSHINGNGFETNFFKREPNWSTKPFNPFNTNNSGYSSDTNTWSNLNKPGTRSDQTNTYSPSNSIKQNGQRKPYGETKSGVRYDIDSNTPVDRSIKKSKQNIPMGKFVQDENQIYDDKCYLKSVVHGYRMGCHNYQGDLRALISYNKIRGTGKSERATQECNMLKEAGVDIECKIDQNRSNNPLDSGRQNGLRKPYGETDSGVRYELDPSNPIKPVDRPIKKPKQGILEGKYVQDENQIYDAKCYQTSVVYEYKIACPNYQEDFRPKIPYNKVRGTGKSERAKQECNMLKEAGVDIECKFSKN